MIYVITALLFFLFGHSMGRAACLDYYPRRMAEATCWILDMLKAMLTKVDGSITVPEMTKYLDELVADLNSGKIRFVASRSMRTPGSAVVRGVDNGPIAE